MTLLAVCIDALEPSLVRRLLAEGRLPNLTTWAQAGRWTTVQADPMGGSPAVWPSFATGERLHEHELTAQWDWAPERMGLRRPTLPAEGPWPGWDLPVGLLDVPGSLPGEPVEGGFVVSQWGAHDPWLAGPRGAHARARPEHLRPLLGGDHPFRGAHYPTTASPTDWATMRRLHATCVEGVRRRADAAARLIAATRPAFALVLFPELHECLHQMWHTVERQHPLYDDIEVPPEAPGLDTVLETIDASLGELVARVGGAAPVVFSLHGATAGRGVVDLLHPLLRARGLATDRGAHRASVAALAARAKRAMPTPIKRAWYRRLPPEAIDAVAMLNVLPEHDWSRTRVFGIANDQHGRLRVNLEGREAQGIVPRANYDGLLDELEAVLRDLADVHGRPLVHALHRWPGDEPPAGGGADLTVEWTLAAMDPELRIDGVPGPLRPVFAHSTGQHAYEGFCLVPDALPALPDEVPVHELAGHLRTLVTAATRS